MNTEYERMLPPQNLEAEASVLGAVIINNECLNDVVSILTVDDFYRDAHKKIFQAEIDIAAHADPIDLITLSEFIKGRNELEGVGGSAYLASLADFVPTAVNVLHYAAIVKEKAALRAIIKSLHDGLDTAYEQGEASTALASRLISSLSATTELPSTGFLPIDKVLVKTVKDLDSLQSGKIKGIPTGSTRLDAATGGILPGELILVAGRPGMGKTAFAQAMSFAGARADYGVAFVSCESAAEKIGQRMIATATGIENRDFRRGRLTSAQVQSVVRRAAEIGKLPIHFLDTELNWDRIRTRIRTLKHKQPKIALVILDYIGLVSAPVQRGERYLELGRISSEAKALAKELDVAFVLLSQLNREVEARDDKRPRISDLRESGCLEQDADFVWLLFREVYYNDEFEPKNLAELNVAKNRDGVTGIIKLQFDERTVSFTDWTDRDVHDARDVRSRAAGE